MLPTLTSSRVSLSSLSIRLPLVSVILSPIAGNELLICASSLSSIYCAPDPFVSLIYRVPRRPFFFLRRRAPYPLEAYYTRFFPSCYPYRLLSFQPLIRRRYSRFLLFSLLRPPPPRTLTRADRFLFMSACPLRLLFSTRFPSFFFYILFFPPYAIPPFAFSIPFTLPIPPPNSPPFVFSPNTPPTTLFLSVLFPQLRRSPFFSYPDIPPFPFFSLPNSPHSSLSLSPAPLFDKSFFYSPLNHPPSCPPYCDPSLFPVP